MSAKSQPGNGKPPGAKKTGRPSSYTEAKADVFIGAILQGKAVTSVLSKRGMPSRPTLFRWLEDNEAFRNRYARAKEFALGLEAEEIKAIPDGIKANATHQEIARQRLRIEAREWRLCHLMPSKYGVQRHEVTGPAGGPIQTEDVTLVRRRVTSRIAGIAGRISLDGVPVRTNGNGTSPR